MDYLVITEVKGDIGNIWSVIRDVTGRTAAYQEHQIRYRNAGKVLHIVNIKNISVIGDKRFSLAFLVYAVIEDKPIYDVLFATNLENAVSEAARVRGRDSHCVVQEAMEIPAGIVRIIVDLQRPDVKRDSAPPLPDGVRVLSREFDEQFKVELPGLDGDVFSMTINFKNGQFVSALYKFSGYIAAGSNTTMHTKSQWVALSKVAGLIDYLEGVKRK